MKALIAVACICIIAVTVGVGLFLLTEYQKAEARELMSKCRRLATTNSESLNEFERAQARILAEKCVAYMRS